MATDVTNQVFPRVTPTTLEGAIAAERAGLGWVRFVCGAPQWFARDATEDDVTEARMTAWHDGRPGW
jgi:hypothetical protein